MKLNKLLLTTSLVTIAVVPAMVTSCHNQPAKTEYELVLDEDLDLYKPTECTVIPPASLKTIDIAANVNYTFSANVVEKSTVQGFALYNSDFSLTPLKDLFSKFTVTHDNKDITTLGKFTNDNNWWFYQDYHQISGKIEVSITFKESLKCVPVFSTDINKN